MRKCVLLLAGLAVATIVVPASASDLTFFFDVRGTAAEITAPTDAVIMRGQALFATGKKTLYAHGVRAGNGGGAGDAQILRISPQLPDSPNDANTLGEHWTCNKKGCVDRSIGSLHLYMTVADRAIGVAEVISSVGLDTAITKLGTPGVGNPLKAPLWTSDTGLWSASGVADPQIAVNGDGYDLTGYKAVQVPVTDPGGGPIYDNTVGATPVGTYHIAELALESDQWDKGAGNAWDQTGLIGRSVGNGTYNVHLTVNNLLVTRVYDNPGGPAPEIIDLGYNRVGVAGTDPCPTVVVSPDEFETANGPDTSPGDGSTVGSTTTEADAQIIIQMKGDFTNDGLVNAADQSNTNGFLWAVSLNNDGCIRQRGTYLGDFNNDNLVNAADNPGFQGMVAASLLDCPCPK